jgi:hypothetical protein
MPIVCECTLVQRVGEVGVSKGIPGVVRRVISGRNLLG